MTWRNYPKLARIQFGETATFKRMTCSGHVTNDGRVSTCAGFPAHGKRCRGARQFIALTVRTNYGGSRIVGIGLDEQEALRAAVRARMNAALPHVEKTSDGRVVRQFTIDEASVAVEG